MINLLSIGLIAVIVVLVLLLWSAKTRVKNCQEDNVKMVMLLADKTKNEQRLMTLIKRLVKDINIDSAHIKEDYFYFTAFDSNNKPIELESIRFKKKDGKVLVYINGAMIPTEEKVFIKNPLLHHSTVKNTYKLIDDKFKDEKEVWATTNELINQIK